MFFYSKEPTKEELKTLLEELNKELRLDKNKLSKRRRKLISVYDGRPSAVHIGYGGMILLVSLVVFIIFLDCLTFFGVGKKQNRRKRE